MAELLQRFTTPRSQLTISVDFLTGADPQPVGENDRVEPFARPVDIGPLRKVVEHSVTLFDVAEGSAWDSWLAPRVHAALRLTPREAADPAIWRWLALYAFPDYVRRRWPRLNVVRFVGPINKQAIGRLGEPKSRGTATTTRRRSRSS